MPPGNTTEQHHKIILDKLLKHFWEFYLEIILRKHLEGAVEVFPPANKRFEISFKQILQF